MVTIQSLKSHIELCNAVGLTGNVEMDLRADLVCFEGYSIEQVVSMSDNQVVEFCNNSEEYTYQNEYGVTCKKCSAIVNLHYSDDPYDCYYTECQCGHIDKISSHYIDRIADQLEWERIASPKVKDMTKGRTCVRVVGEIPANELRQNGELIQVIELDYKQEYYMLNNKPYVIIDGDTHKIT
ncbi:hypothetical protein EEL31_09215 [Brevibacillus laterosporus]|nr:hypothetical protein [Brevibacillus laterosporus]TPG68686.1 hypothetical protein EEL31_09215 [Brevibacillus laterosporus]